VGAHTAGRCTNGARAASAALQCSSTISRHRGAITDQQPQLASSGRGSVAATSAPGLCCRRRGQEPGCQAGGHEESAAPPVRNCCACCCQPRVTLPDMSTSQAGSAMDRRVSDKRPSQQVTLRSRLRRAAGWWSRSRGRAFFKSLLWSMQSRSTAGWRAYTRLKPRLAL
jgi:hypothetical protein